MADAPPRGAMHKVGRRLKRVERRFYVIRQDQLYYGVGESEQSKLIPLDRCVVTNGPETALSGVGNVFGLVLQTPEKHHTLYASSEPERERWLQSLRTICTRHSVDNAYLITKVLGKGAFSEVKLGQDRSTDKLFALKIIDRRRLDDIEVEMLHKEVEIMRMTKHPNIVEFRDFVETEKSYFVIMEFLSGGELFDRIISAAEGRYTERDACMVMQQILSALVYLHEQYIVHRDLKPENFLLADNSADTVVKIADFGFATICKPGTVLDDVCGSPGYVAPEVIREKGYGLAADMWSMGVILYILLTGFPPFMADTDEESFRNTIRGEYDIGRLQQLGNTEAAIDLVRQLLQYQPERRLTARQAFQHVWIAGGEAGTQPLGMAQANLKKWLARRRLKKAMVAVRTTTRMARITRLTAAMKTAAASEEAPAF
mmetsp:Transcript_63556/g.150594  ORF Transcript_63556/g.150594 Transcript_63556/m.150594 type:complete len:429 (+) Transcript_63556:3-1289(+)